MAATELFSSPIERELMTKTHPTTFPLQSTLELFSPLLPERVTGLTIVDIGAGASPLRAFLAHSGAHAYAVDACYLPEWQVLAGKTLREFIDREYLYTFFHWMEPEQEEFERYLQAASDFFRDYEKSPQYYIGAPFSKLPFGDQFADCVVSVNAIGDLEDNKLVEQSVAEALRITKIAGTVLIVPLLIRMLPVWRDLATSLSGRGHGVVFSHIEVNGKPSIRMQVTRTC